MKGIHAFRWPGIENRRERWIKEEKERKRQVQTDIQTDIYDHVHTNRDPQLENEISCKIRVLLNYNRSLGI